MSDQETATLPDTGVFVQFDAVISNTDMVGEESVPPGVLMFLGKAVFRHEGRRSSIADEHALPPRLILWAHVSPQVLSAEHQRPSRLFRTPFHARLQAAVMEMGSDDRLLEHYDVQWSSGLGQIVLLVPPNTAPLSAVAERPRVMALLVPDEESRPYLAYQAPRYEEHRYAGIRLAYSVRRVPDPMEVLALRDPTTDIECSVVSIGRAIQITRGPQNLLDQVRHAWEKIQRHWKELEMVRRHVDHVCQLQKEHGDRRGSEDTLCVDRDPEDSGETILKDGWKNTRPGERLALWLKTQQRLGAESET